MTIQLPPLPFARDALAPYISKETIDFHYDKHHQTYVTNLNNLIKDTPQAEQSLENIVKNSQGAIFNNAAQVWNHNFYWLCLAPTGSKPSAALTQALEANFGSLAAFQEQFTKTALATFGSGWAWLVKNAQQQLEIVSTSNAQTPLTGPAIPLMTCDVWEHAYYIDYRNARAKYLENFWQVLNWDFVSQQFSKA